MSAQSDRRPVVGFVCEGSTDYVILRAVAEELLGPIDALSLQPQTDDLDRQQPGTAGGWSEVRAWCRRLQAWDEMFEPLIGDPLDLLVIALDLDIAVKAGFEKRPESLSAYDAKRLCDLVKGWLPEGLDRRVLIVIPVMSMEAWVLAALFPRLARPEQDRDPARTLVARKKLEMGRTGPWKQASAYRGFAATICKRLKRVRAACAEAERYATKIERWRSQRAHG